MREMILELRERGAKNVVLKGYRARRRPHPQLRVGRAIDFTETTQRQAALHAARHGRRVREHPARCGDGRSNLAEATAFAADFTADAMLISAKQPNFRRPRRLLRAFAREGDSPAGVKVRAFARLAPGRVWAALQSSTSTARVRYFAK